MCTEGQETPFQPHQEWAGLRNSVLQTRFKGAQHSCVSLVALHFRWPNDKEYSISHSVKTTENSVLALEELGYCCDQKRGVILVFQQFLFRHALAFAVVILERSGKHIPVTGCDRRQK